MWALYKEVQDYVDRGMQVPDDVLMLFADDNWGHIRRLPTPAERGRRGGSAMAAAAVNAIASERE